MAVPHYLNIVTVSGAAVLVPGTSYGAARFAPPLSNGAGSGPAGQTCGTSTGYARAVVGATNAAAALGGTVQPSGTPNGSDSWRDDIYFDALPVASQTWTLGINGFANTVGATVSVLFRVWMNTAKDGSGTWTEVTSGAVESNTVTVSSGALQTLTATFNPGAVSLTGWMFVQVAFHSHGAGATGADFIVEADNAFVNLGNGLGTPLLSVPDLPKPFPYVVGVGAFASGTAAITPAIPGCGYAAGDVFYMFGESANQAMSLTTANGFAAVTSQGTGVAAATTATALQVWSCLATSGSMSNPVVADSGDHTDAFIVVVRNANGATPNVFGGGVNGGTASASVSVPGATTTVANTLVLAAAANPVDSAADQSNNNWANANLKGPAQIFSANTSAGNGGGVSVAAGVWESTGAYGSTTMTRLTSTVQALVSVAIAPATVAGAALAGATTGTASETGALTTAIKLAGAAAGTASETGALTTAIKLQGSSSGVASETGALTTAVQLQGSSSGVASETGALTTAVQLQGSSSGVASETGALTTAVQLQGSSSGVASETGALTTAVQLQGSSSGVASETGALTTAVQLQGSSSGVASETGALTTAVQLQGDSLCSSDSSGDLTVEAGAAGAALAGDSDCSSGLSGDLTAEILLAGDSAGSASETGALTTAVQLRGDSDCTSAAAGTLTSVSLPVLDRAGRGSPLDVAASGSGSALEVRGLGGGGPLDLPRAGSSPALELARTAGGAALELEEG